MVQVTVCPDETKTLRQRQRAVTDYLSVSVELWRVCVCVEVCLSAMRCMCLEFAVWLCAWHWYDIPSACYIYFGVSVCVCVCEMRQGQRVHTAAVLSISFPSPSPSLPPSSRIHRHLSLSLPLSYFSFFPWESDSEYPSAFLSVWMHSVSLSLSHTFWGWYAVCTFCAACASLLVWSCVCSRWQLYEVFDHLWT